MLLAQGGITSPGCVIARLDRAIQILRQAQDNWLGAYPALDTGVKPENDALFMKEQRMSTFTKIIAIQPPWRRVLNLINFLGY